MNPKLIRTMNITTILKTLK